jgi:hypothetical protein
MPLGAKITFVDESKKIQNITVQAKESGYAPTPEYHPTMKMVKCAGCGGIGVCEFLDGFDLKKADSLMAGKPITGVCFRCRKTTEMIPIVLKPSDESELKMLYGIQRSLEEAAKNGESLHTGILTPVGIRKKYERASERSTPSPESPA